MTVALPLTVIPCHKLSGTQHSRQIIFSLDSEFSIRLAAIGQDDGIMSRPQFLDRDICADMNIAIVAYSLFISKKLYEVILYIFDFGMVRCDAKSDQSKRSWESFEHANGNVFLVDSVLLEARLEVLGCVTPRRTASDNGYFIRQVAARIRGWEACRRARHESSRAAARSQPNSAVILKQWSDHVCYLYTPQLPRIRNAVFTS